MSNTILVVIEQREGKILPASFQLFTPAKALAAARGGEVAACIVGHNVGGLAAAVSAYGPAAVYVVDDAELKLYRPAAYAAAVANGMDASAAGTVLLSNSALGRDLASRLAARRRAALVLDCTELKADGGEIVATKTLYAGKTFARFRTASGRPAVLTVRANAYVAPAAQAGASSPVKPVAAALSDADKRLTVREVARTGSGIKDVTEADVIVSGGRALKSEENFKKVIFPLAEALGAAVGASRAACDAGYQPHSRQVGLTGKVVTPRLYFACGIDGAIQHLAGMRGSKVIVAVNTKKEAPIFQVATYGCVADLFTLLPALTEEVKKISH